MDRRIQVSIFMSPVNVHVNRYPVSGKVTYYKYHPGLYLVAWHPKSSTENERTTVVVETANKIPILIAANRWRSCPQNSLLFENW